MARPRKTWTYSVGRYGATVRIWEPRLAAPLRWDYTENGKRRRPEVKPLTRVRTKASQPPDPMLEQAAKDLCEQKAATLTLEPLREATEPEALTVGMAYSLYFDPKRKALPKSKAGRVHVEGSRKFWLAQLKPETRWDAIAPADVKAGLETLIEAGKIPTAEKRLANLVTLYHWLVDGMGYDLLRNPARGIDFKKLMDGYQPRRPRYTTAEVDRLIEKSRDKGPRFDLFVKLMADSGARAGQVRMAVRSGLNCALEPPPPAGMFPLGWLALPKVKGQPAMLTALTRRQREALDVALAGYLAALESAWLENGTDYYLIPGGNVKAITASPITDNALRHMWAKLEEAAEIPKVKRRAFHGSRRAWSDDIHEHEGLETLTAAGGWTKSETPESIYLSKAKYSHIERARKRRERE
jgi:integrase